MDIPSTDNNESAPRIRNLHPSHISPDQQHLYRYDSYGATSQDIIGAIPERLSGTSLSERIGSFVGSYSRTSLMFMAENLTVPGASPSKYDEEEDKLSTVSAGSISRRTTTEPGENRTRRSQSFHSHLDHERTSLLMTGLDKVMTTHSIATVADDYRLASAISRDPYTTTGGVSAVVALDDHKKSSFAQSIFNSINILLGVGILALPLGFKCAGWVIGLSVFSFCCFLTNYTAKLLGQCLEADPESRTFGDLAGAAFGMNGRIFVTALFVTELITNSVAMVVLLSDGVDSLFPGFDTLTLRIVSFIILTPMLFFPVRYLSYSSLLGIISAISIIVVMLIDGFSKREAPGSLLDPADTSVWPLDWMAVPLSFGLIMAGFAGHAVFPTVYRDMENPKRYETMVNWTYIATTAVYFGVAACGYLMFGSEVLQEITQNIVLVPEYNQTLNRLAVWLIALQPIAKYGLNLNPVNLSWQIMLFRYPPVEQWCAKAGWREPFLSMIGKVLISIFIVVLAYLIPGFEKVMALIGSFFSFMISGILPLLCYLRIFGGNLSFASKVWNYILVFIATCMAISGTLWSFI